MAVRRVADQYSTPFTTVVASRGPWKQDELRLDVSKSVNNTVFVTTREIVAALLERIAETLENADALPYAEANVVSEAQLFDLATRCGDSGFEECVYQRLSEDIQSGLTTVAEAMSLIPAQITAEALATIVHPIRLLAERLADDYEQAEQRVLAVLKASLDEEVREIDGRAAKMKALPPDPPGVAAPKELETFFAAIERINEATKGLHELTHRALLEKRALLELNYQLFQARMNAAKQAIVEDLWKTDFDSVVDIHEKYRDLGMLMKAPEVGGWAIDAVLAVKGLPVLAAPFGILGTALLERHAAPALQRRAETSMRSAFASLCIMLACGILPGLAIQTARLKVVGRLVG